MEISNDYIDILVEYTESNKIRWEAGLCTTYCAVLVDQEVSITFAIPEKRIHFKSGRPHVTFDMSDHNFHRLREAIRETRRVKSQEAIDFAKYVFEEHYVTN